MRNFIVFFFLFVSAYANNLDSFLAAIAKVESSNNPNALNKKENAIGIYQIRSAYFKDSRMQGKHSDVCKPEIAKKVVLAYFARYEPKALKNNDFETLARLHNGGPNFRKKSQLTDNYWAKVKKNL